MKIIHDDFILRPIEKKDAKAMFEYACLSDIGPSAGWLPHTTLYETKAVIKGMLKKDDKSTGVYAITIDDHLIGTIDIHKIIEGHQGEIGFVLHPDYHRQGIMTKAAKMMIIHAFEVLHLKRLVYTHFTDNIASKNLAQKLRFKYEGLLRNGYMFQTGLTKDLVINAMTIKDYQNDYLEIYQPFKERLIIV